MATMRSGCRTSNQQELLALLSNVLHLTSIQGQPQEIMVALEDCIHDTYLATLNIYTSEHIKIYDKAIVGLPESERYDFTRSKWTDFYQ